MQYGVQGRKVVGYRSTKVYMELDGWAVASVRVARRQKNVLGVGSEFVVFEFSVVRHDDINLPRFASIIGVVSWTVRRGTAHNVEMCRCGVRAREPSDREPD